MKECFIKIKNHSFRYLERDGKGPTLLFLHGLSDFAGQILPMADFLPVNWHILALDQRGHGSSWQPIKGYSPLDFARDVKIFMEKLNIAPAILFGHSMGGRNAMVCAAKYPELIDSLILGDIGPDQNLKDVRETISFFTNLPDLFNSKEEAFLHLKGRKPAYNHRQLSLLMQNLETGEKGKLQWRYSKSACIQSVQEARSRGWGYYYKKIECRTLLIHVKGSGELSENTASKMNQEIKNIQYERMYCCGHNFHIEKPKEAAGAIIKFINAY